MGKWVGLGDRIKERLLALGYVEGRETRHHALLR